MWTLKSCPVGLLRTDGLLRIARTSRDSPGPDDFRCWLIPQARRARAGPARSTRRTGKKLANSAVPASIEAAAT